MLIASAYAQSASSIGGSSFIINLLPFVAIIAIFYFLLIRPQRQRAKQHSDMVANLQRGDMVVTSGGLIGKISRIIDDREVQVELAEGIKVRMIRQMIQEVRTKSEPVTSD